VPKIEHKNPSSIFEYEIDLFLEIVALGTIKMPVVLKSSHHDSSRNFYFMPKPTGCRAGERTFSAKDSVLRHWD
jgi:hypothetical protein